MKTEDYKEMLEVELSNMKMDKKLRRFNVTLNALSNKFDVWIEWSDGHAGNFNDILTVTDLKTVLNNSLPVKKSWKCRICRFYIKASDGCKKGFYNSMFIPCPDWRGAEYQPTDDDMCKALDILVEESQAMVSPIVHIHKGADWLMTYILDMVGYDLTLFNKIPKGYEEDPDNYIEFVDIIPWQCYLCREFVNRDMSCKWGHLEGWQRPNECRFYKSSIGESINQKFFKYTMEVIFNEKEDNEVSWETIHYNMDRFMSYVIESLGYFKFAKKYRELKLQYLDVPF